MPLSLQEIKEHKDQFGLHELDTMHIETFRQALKDEAFMWLDHHNFLRSTLSGEIFATNIEQLEALIGYLNKCRDRMPKSPK